MTDRDIFICIVMAVFIIGMGLICYKMGKSDDWEGE